MQSICNNVSDANPNETNVGSCFGKPFNMFADFVPLSCRNELTKETEHGMDPKEKAVSVHTLLVVTNGNESFNSDFINAFNVLGIDKSLLSNVIVIGKDETPSGFVDRFSEMPYRDGMADFHLVGAEKNVGFVSTRTVDKSVNNWCCSGRFNNNYRLFVGALFYFGADFDSRFIENKITQNDVDPLELMGCLNEHNLSGNGKSLSDFLDIINTLAVEGIFLKYTLMCALDNLPGRIGEFSEIIPGDYIGEFSKIHGGGIMAIERFPFVVLEMLLSFITCMLLCTNCGLFSIRLLYQMWVDLDREWFVWSFLEVDVSEMWSFPFKGGGNDTYWITAFVGNVSQLGLLFVMKIFILTWMLFWMDTCWELLIRVGAYLSSIVRAIWLVAWNTVCLVPLVRVEYCLSFMVQGQLYIKTLTRYIWLVAWVEYLDRNTLDALEAWKRNLWIIFRWFGVLLVFRSMEDGLGAFWKCVLTF